ncbi:hypothetical protein BH11BAC4_BH11BAC4_20990 [soil metagenome]
MKNFVVLLFFVPLFAAAQKTHTVQAKETLYSLARKYNVHPRELAAYNNIPVETGLVLGQVIKIPAKTTMAPLSAATAPKTEPVEQKGTPKTVEPVKKEEVATTVPAKKEGNYPIYHKVAKKETLYHISKLYAITIDDIKKWNKVNGDGVSEGTNLIVGYSKTMNAVAETKPVVIEEVPKQVQVETVKKKEETKQVFTTPVETPKAKESEKIVKTEPIKEEPKSITGKNFKGGIFKDIYKDQVADKKDIAEEKGTAGTFKSTSGWEDGKYYCLSNSIPSGTIVKVTNPVTQKIVYAKVLDLIPDLKQNAGLVLRISNAAAQELGAGNENFECTLNF